ncbi:MAG: TrbI/VirB10 family protein [Pseudomonadota bacterium]
MMGDKHKKKKLDRFKSLLADQHTDINTTDKTTTAQNQPRRSVVFGKTFNTNKIIFAALFIFAVLMLFVMLGHRKENNIIEKQEKTLRGRSSVFSNNARQLHQPESALPQSPLISSLGNNAQAKHRPTNMDENNLAKRMGAPIEVFGQNEQQASAQNEKNVTHLLIGGDAFSQYANAQSTDLDTVTAQRITHPNATIVQGEFIHATLETAINSDLPGMVRAVISEPVYAYRGMRPLIPAGSRLVGQYASMSSNGQASSRVFIMWNRIITPQGISLIINSPSSDFLGRAGSPADAKDVHFFQRFGTATLISLIGAGAATIGVNNQDQYNSDAAYRQAISNSFAQQAGQTLQSQRNIQPTLHIHQGAAIVVFVARDLDLSGTVF